jgi:ribosome-associated translation inhibitor RaiA
MMMPQLEIAFRGMETSEFVERNVQEHVERLSKLSERLLSCRVLIEAPSHHHTHGAKFHVRVDLHLPGEHIIIDRDPGRDMAHSNAYVAIADAFHAAKRRIEESARRRRSDRHREAPEPEGT